MTVPKLSTNNDLNYYNQIDPRLLAILYFRHIYLRVHRYKFNFLGMFTGKHRTGKSLTSLSMATSLDKTFEDNLEDRVVYFPNDFMRALQSVKKKNIVGGAIIWDEAGVGIPARDWYDISNKSIGYTLQVFGRYRPIVYFVTQDVHYIDSQARKLFHGFYEMNRLTNKQAICRLFDVKYNKRSGKTYYVYPRFHNRREGAVGEKVILKAINMSRPPSEVEDRYEIHSKLFKDKIVEQMQERSEKMREGKIDKNRMTMQEIISVLIENKEEPLYLSKRSKPENVIFDKDSVRIEFDVTESQARHIKRLAEIKVNKVPEEEQIVEKIPENDG